MRLTTKIAWKIALPLLILDQIKSIRKTYILYQIIGWNVQKNHLTRLSPLLSHPALLKVQICFSIYLILYEFFNNTLKEIYRSQKVRQKHFIVFGTWAKAFKRTRRLRRFLNVFIYTYKVVFEYAKSIFACTKKTPKVSERVKENTARIFCLIGRIR